jgi:hypothetical protein
MEKYETTGFERLSSTKAINEASPKADKIQVSQRTPPEWPGPTPDSHTRIGKIR